ncbi:MAG: methyltransferase domain-containing protein, partial [Gammaproteobacteria bacterium]
MTKEDQVAAHYASASLVEAIKRGIQQLGKTTLTATIADLAPVDEFHIGGRQATMDFMDQLSLRDTDSVLDIGCGIGGAARFVADHYRAKVTGIDLTKEFVETGEEICRWLGLDDRVSLQQGSALNLPFEPSSFHHAYMMHVGMNIADKGSLARQVARVVKPGGTFGIFDVMRTGDEELLYPVPWATIADT